jgi:outer membrane protein assembly factor BamB
VSELTNLETAYTFLYKTARSAGKSKAVNSILAIDDKTGKQKWIHDSPMRYNSFDLDEEGNVYYYDEVMSGNKKVYKLIALDSNNKQRWVKTFKEHFQFNILEDGRIAVVTFTKDTSVITIYNQEGKQLIKTEFPGHMRHIQGNYVGLINSNAPRSTTTIDIYSISTGKKVVTAVQPQDHVNIVHADFEVLSGGTVIVPTYDAKTKVETLHGYKSNGEEKWTRRLPKPAQDAVYGTTYAHGMYDSIYVSLGNNYLIQEKNKLSLYNTNNQLIATKTFDDLPAQGLLQQLNDYSIVFGATDKSQAWYDSTKPEPKKAVYYILDSRTLKVKNTLELDEALFHQADIRFHDANTFYIHMGETITKYVLK